jgi:hypothetical protein
MIIAGIKEFEDICKQKLVGWYNSKRDTTLNHTFIMLENTYTTYICGTSQGYECIVTVNTTEGWFCAKYTYDYDDRTLCEEVYQKLADNYYTERL